MLELRFIRENAELVKAKMLHRGMDGAKIDRFVAIDQDRRQLLTEVEGLRNTRKTVSQEIAGLKAKQQDAEGLMQEMRQVGDRIKALEERLGSTESDLNAIVMEIPNLCQDSVPKGKDEHDNVEVKRVGEPAVFPFTPKAHWQLGEELGVMDFERAAKLSGARFAVLKGMASRLERALINFMLDLHTQRHGYQEVLPPFLLPQ